MAFLQFQWTIKINIANKIKRQRQPNKALKRGHAPDKQVTDETCVMYWNNTHTNEMIWAAVRITNVCISSPRFSLNIKNHSSTQTNIL